MPTGAPTALITGANRGLGLGFTEWYADHGWRVIATCRDPAAATDLQQVEGDVVIHRLDVTDEQQRVELGESLGDTPIDLLLSNAAVRGGRRTLFGRCEMDEWAQVLSTNVLGAMAVPMDLIDNVAASQQRRIVFLSSRSSQTGRVRPGRSYAYGTSKAALNLAARQLAADVRDLGIGVGVINPGHVRTSIGGAGAAMSVQESVRAVAAVVEGVSVDTGGRFLHFDGSELPP
ncbi:MAG: SDR family NAD(P)-dependent oxidoreductase [Acidimicrobiia bacterium]|nr:SDR family NAD(P)-dependent oxidoreductase [Acidimicrobiia bacterium]